MASIVATAIARAFEVVSSNAAYRKRWVSENDWAAIICKEYDVPKEATGPTILHHLKACEKSSTTVHRKVIVTEQDETTTFYHVGDTTPKKDAETYNAKNDAAVKHCKEAITPKVRFHLLSVLVPEIEKQRGMMALPVAAGGKRSAPSSEASDNNGSNKKQKAPSDNNNVKPPPVYPMHPTIMPPMGFPQVIPPMIPPSLVLQEAARRSMPLPAPRPKNPKAKFEIFETTISIRAAEIETILGKYNDATRNEILRVLLRRKSMEGAKKALQNTFQPPVVENAICSGIHSFLQHHRGGGSRVKHEQDAIDAVMTAVCFSPSCEAYLTHIGHRIEARSTKQLREYRARAKEMKQSGTKFQPKRRKKRKDCWREDAINCVRDFIHSDASSHLDTRSKARVFKIEHPYTKEKESHPARIWNTSGSQASRHHAFLESDEYKEFQKSGKTIGLEVFRRGLCKCIHEPREPEKSADVKNNTHVMAWAYE